MIRFCAEAAAGEYVFKHTHNQQLVPLLRFLEVFDSYDTPPAALINNNKSSSSMPVSADDILRNLHPNRSIAHDYARG